MTKKSPLFGRAGLIVWIISFLRKKILDKLSLECHTSDKSRTLNIRLSGKDLKRERFLSKTVWMSQNERAAKC